MKIGVTCFSSSGGSGVVAAELGRAMAERGHDVHFIGLAPPFRFGRPRRGLHFHPVHVADYPVFKLPSYGMSLATALAEVAERERLDLLHVHYAFPHAASAVLARDMLAGTTRVVTTLHGTDITLVKEHPGHDRIVRHAIEQSDAVTAVSGYLAALTRDTLGVERAIDVVPNFVDTRRFHPALVDPARRARYAAPDETLFIHVSNFRPIKRVGDVMQAFRIVQAVTPARLLLVGSGPERRRWREFARDCGLAERVHFTGELRRIHRLMPLADCLLSASEREGFGLAALEAMACGLPVVSTRCGGIEEFLDHGREGALVDVGDTEALAREALRFATDLDLRRTLGQNARNRVVGGYSLDAVVDRYERIYEAALDPARAASPRRHAAMRPPGASGA